MASKAINSVFSFAIRVSPFRPAGGWIAGDSGNSILLTIWIESSWILMEFKNMYKLCLKHGSDEFNFVV